MLTTTVGNYPKIGGKAPNLRAAKNRLDRGETSPEEVARIADEVTKEVLQEQIDAGVDLVTDGQIRWDDGQTYFARGMTGFSIKGLTRYFDNNTYYRQPVVEGKIGWSSPISTDHFTFASGNSSKPVKAILTGPYSLGRLSVLEAGYEGLGPLVLDLAEALNNEALALQKAGASIIQFDEPCILRHPEDIDLFLEASERVVRGLTVKTAVYTYFADASKVADGLLRSPFLIIGLDFASSDGNWQVVEKFPADKELGFGIVNGRNTGLETADQIAQACQRVMQHVPQDRLYVNPNSGLEYLPREKAQQKLERLVEGVNKAREVVRA
ncbi:MAG: 5-methyltetrahydropteroyltriglutamate--homocysteine methyltransferase [Chloroflexi bacterium]|nr:MAG: 5-methyltetrahydropteroyltriglutamate--homocysteine methyltransferase [Chloroflexota bacterium]